jgi:hypothetical protein
MHYHSPFFALACTAPLRRRGAMRAVGEVAGWWKREGEEEREHHLLLSTDNNDSKLSRLTVK